MIVSLIALVASAAWLRLYTLAPPESPRSSRIPAE